MNRLQILMLSVMLMLGMGGCEKSAGGGSAASSYGVVDVPVLMKALGDDMEIENELKRVGAQRTKDLNQIRTTLLEQYEAKKREYGDNPTEAQKKDLALMQQTAASTYRENQMKANNEYTNLRNQLLSAKQKEYSVMVEKMAKEKGLKLVLYTGTVGNVVYHHDSIDLTSEIAEKLKVSRAASGGGANTAPSGGTTAPGDAGTGTGPSGDGGGETKPAGDGG